MPGTSNRSRYQRRRLATPHSNNSVRRTYDLLRSTLPTLEPDALLIEDDLINSLSASRNTVRVVLQLLAAQGLVRRGPKVGTTVGMSTVLPLDEIMPIPDQNVRRPMHGRVLETIVIPAPSVVGRRLELADDAQVAMIEGLVLEDTTPIALSVSYIGLTPEQRDQLGKPGPDPIVFLEQHLEVGVVGSDAMVAALAADAQTAAFLEILEGAPILFCEDLFRDTEGRPRALSQTRYRGDRVTLSASTRRRG